MQLITDNRAVSEVVGAILVFGLLIALMAIMQTQAVPQANQQVEFDHNQEVQGDLVHFHQAASKVATRGSAESVSIEAGTGYPTRMLFFNPPRVMGTVATSDAGTVVISNLSATDPAVADYLDGSDLTLESKTLRYQVSYNELQNVPTTRYEYGILYNDHGEEATVTNPGSVVDDTDINLVFMAGNYSRTSGNTQSLDVRPVSAPARSVTVTGDGDDDITLELPTDLNHSVWDELYGDQDHVTVKDAGPDTVRLILDGERRYTLRMAGIGLEQGVDKPDAHYIAPADDGVTTVGAGQTTSVRFEVRDEYNNPVSGVDVEITLPDGSTVTNTTDGEGQVTASVTPDTGGQVFATAEMQTDDCPGSDRCDARYTVQVTDLQINPGSGVRLENVELESDPDIADAIGAVLGGEIENAALLEFSNTGSTEMQFSEVRVNHYHKPGSEEAPSDWIMADDGASAGDEIEGQVSGEFVDTEGKLDAISPGGTETYEVAFQDGDTGREITNDDFFVVTVVFEDNSQALYFVSP